MEDADARLGANIFDVSVASHQDGPYTKVLSDVSSCKGRHMRPQGFRISALARYIRIEPSALGSGFIHLTQVSDECPRSTKYWLWPVERTS